jgi:hypothetical protein
MTEEDEEFQRLEREVEMRRMVVRRIVEEDDDIQDYKKPWVGLTGEDFSAIKFPVEMRFPAEFRAGARWAEAKLKEKNA